MHRRRQIFIEEANSMNDRNIFSNFSLSTVYTEHFNSGVFDAGIFDRDYSQQTPWHLVLP